MHVAEDQLGLLVLRCGWRAHAADDLVGAGKTSGRVGKQFLDIGLQLAEARHRAGHSGEVGRVYFNELR